jgi:hypothetical protein
MVDCGAKMSAEARDYETSAFPRRKIRRKIAEFAAERETG